MGNTVANVLVGVANLAIRQPNDALAEWSSVKKYVGTHSAKLSKTGSGNAGSTHVEFNVKSVGTTMALWTAGLDTNSFYHLSQAVLGNFAQFEFRFEDPDSDAWAEITDVDLQNVAPSGAWEKQTCGDADLSGIGGVDEIGASFFDWGLAALNEQQAAIEALTSGADCANWILSRIRVELWESSPARYSYVDSVEIMGITYAIEPGGDAPDLSLSAPYTDVGYTEDGVTFDYGVDTADIEVEEETFPVERRITKETLGITCNMAESSLFNIDKAIAGSVLSGSIITLGAGVLKKMSIKLDGTNPAGFTRSIELPLVTATGAVGMSYKKGEKTVVPVTFQALKPASGSVCTIVDNAA